MTESYHGFDLIMAIDKHYPFRCCLKPAVVITIGQTVSRIGKNPRFACDLLELTDQRMVKSAFQLNILEDANHPPYTTDMTYNIGNRIRLFFLDQSQ